MVASFSWRLRWQFFQLVFDNRITCWISVFFVVSLLISLDFSACSLALHMRMVSHVCRRLSTLASLAPSTFFRRFLEIFWKFFWTSVSQKNYFNYRNKYSTAFSAGLRGKYWVEETFQHFAPCFFRRRKFDFLNIRHGNMVSLCIYLLYSFNLNFWMKIWWCCLGLIACMFCASNYSEESSEKMFSLAANRLFFGIKLAALVF